MLPTYVAISRTADVTEKAGISLLVSVSETDVQSVGHDFPCSRERRTPQHHDVVPLHKPITLMPVPLALHWNLKMPKNVLVDAGGELIAPTT